MSAFKYPGVGPDHGVRTAAYRTLFRAHLDDEALDKIRKAANRGLPLGSDRFREQVEAALGRRETESPNAVLPGQMGLDL